MKNFDDFKKNNGALMALTTALSKDKICSTNGFSKRCIYNRQESLRIFAKRNNISLKYWYKKDTISLINSYCNSILSMLYLYYNTNLSVRKIAKKCKMSKDVLCRALHNYYFIKKYNKKYKDKKYIGKTRESKNYSVYYNHSLYYLGSSTGLQDKVLCKYYQRVLKSLLSLYILNTDNTTHTISPFDPPYHSVPFKMDIPWIIFFLFDNEDMTGLNNKNSTMTCLQLFVGGMWDNNHSDKMMLDWFSKYDFVSHRRGNKPRIVYYRNPDYPTFSSVLRENYECDKYDIQHKGITKHNEWLLKMNEADLSNKYSPNIAGILSKT